MIVEEMFKSPESRSRRRDFRGGFRRPASRTGRGPKIVYRSEREDWIQMMVAAGHGVTLMPESLHLGHGTLAPPLIDPALNREVALGPAVAMNGAACWSSHGRW